MDESSLIVIGASAGGVEALPALLGKLPEGFPGAICVVLHLSPHSPSYIPAIISRDSKLPARQAEHGDRLRPGYIFFAPPDRHLIITEDHLLHLGHGPRVNRHRPSIDVLFRSAAETFGPRVIGIVLTGCLDDGTAGLQAIKRAGGTAVVQDPADAAAPAMPQSALRHVAVDHCLPLAEIPPLLVKLASSSQPETHAMNNSPHDEYSSNEGPAHKKRELGPPSAFVCPDCSGALWEVRDDKVVQYTCHMGHAFSPDSLLGAQGEELERSLYVAVRTLLERADLLTRLAEQISAGGASPATFEDRAEEHREHATIIRSFLEKNLPGKKRAGRE
jgi:two-component system, chemotaxis family, protein-glutamate methylesterase/glutaminase